MPPYVDKIRKTQYFLIIVGLSILIQSIGTWKWVYKDFGAW